MRQAVAVAAALLLAASPALAFASIASGDAPHDEATAVAAELGWPKGAVELLQASVRQPDIDDLQPAPVEGDKERLDMSPLFRPWHHCDRVAPADDADAVNATIAYVAQERALARELVLLDPEAAVHALGRALHALQDCFSHSNVVDLPPEAQKALGDALVHNRTLTVRLRVCGVAPGALDIERPSGDAYPHADFNKDDKASSPEADLLMPDGRSKHEHAKALATNATRAFLADFMADLDALGSERLLGVKPPHPEKSDALRIPAPASGVLVAALLAVAVTQRRLRGRP